MVYFANKWITLLANFVTEKIIYKTLPMEHKFTVSNLFFSAVRKTVSLYKNLWKEGTTALIHGPRSVDKSAKALDIALELARNGREVLYVNTGNSLDRYAGSGIGDEHLYMFTPEYESVDDNTDYADLVFEAIEQAVRTTSIRTFVIDSVSRIAALSFGRNASAAYIMKRIVALQVKCRLSVLVVADDATRTVNNALLALAAAEITIDDSADCSEAKDISGHTGDVTLPGRVDAGQAASLTEKASEPSDPPYLYDFPEIPSAPLTRQQRRAMERRAAKFARRIGR